MHSKKVILKKKVPSDIHPPGVSLLELSNCLRLVLVLAHIGVEKMIN